MSKLQELLDERWPISEDATMADRLTIGSFRMIFTEGYNAAMEEMRQQKESIDKLEATYNPKWDHSDFHTIK